MWGNNYDMYDLVKDPTAFRKFDDYITTKRFYSLLQELGTMIGFPNMTDPEVVEKIRRNAHLINSGKKTLEEVLYIGIDKRQRAEIIEILMDACKGELDNVKFTERVHNLVSELKDKALQTQVRESMYQFFYREFNLKALDYSKELHPCIAMQFLSTFQVPKKSKTISEILEENFDLTVKDVGVIYGFYKGRIEKLAALDDPVFVRAVATKLAKETYGILGYTTEDVLRHVEEFRNQNDKTKSLDKVMSLMDLTKSSDNEDFIVDRLLTSSGLFILAAAPKTYKSLLCYHLAYSVVNGTPFLDRFGTTKGKVLYVQAEEPLPTIKQRINSVGFDFLNENIRILRKFNILEGTSKLEEAVKEFKPSLIIFDTLRAITSGSEYSENSPEFSKHLYSLQAFCNSHNICGLVVHHKNKSNTQNLNAVSGTLALAGATDGIILLDAMPNNHLHMVTIPRSLPQSSWVIKVENGFSKETGRYGFKFSWVGSCPADRPSLDSVNYHEDQLEILIEKYLSSQSVAIPISTLISSLSGSYPKHQVEKALNQCISYGVAGVEKDHVYWHRSEAAKTALKLNIDLDAANAKMMEQVLETTKPRSESLEEIIDILKEMRDELRKSAQIEEDNFKQLEPAPLDDVSAKVDTVIEALRAELKRRSPSFLDLKIDAAGIELWVEYERRLVPKKGAKKAKVRSKVYKELVFKVSSALLDRRWRTNPLTVQQAVNALSDVITTEPAKIELNLPDLQKDHLGHIAFVPGSLSENLGFYLERAVVYYNLAAVYVLENYFNPQAVESELLKYGESTKALYGWLKRRLEVFLEKDVHNMLSRPPIHYVRRLREYKVEEHEHERKLLILLDLLNTGFVGYTLEMHKVAPPEECWQAFKDKKVSHLRIFPKELTPYENGWVPEVFTRLATSLWGDVGKRMSEFLFDNEVVEEQVSALTPPPGKRMRKKMKEQQQQTPVVVKPIDEIDFVDPLSLTDPLDQRFALYHIMLGKYKEEWFRYLPHNIPPSSIDDIEMFRLFLKRYYRMIPVEYLYAQEADKHLWGMSSLYKVGESNERYTIPLTEDSFLNLIAEVMHELKQERAWEIEAYWNTVREGSTSNSVSEYELLHADLNLYCRKGITDPAETVVFYTSDVKTKKEEIKSKKLPKSKKKLNEVKGELLEALAPPIEDSAEPINVELKDDFVGNIEQYKKTNKCNIDRRVVDRYKGGNKYVCSKAAKLVKVWLESGIDLPKDVLTMLIFLNISPEEFREGLQSYTMQEMITMTKEMFSAKYSESDHTKSDQRLQFIRKSLDKESQIDGKEKDNLLRSG